MESLLRWSIANSTPQDANQPPPRPRTDLDPGIIDAILGKPDAELMKQALKRPKLKQQDVEKGLGKKRKNMEVDEMGDLRGRLHVGKQDLNKLQTRKMKGLKEGPAEKRQRVEEDEE